jgi:predicted nucleotidyltransferase
MAVKPKAAIQELLQIFQRDNPPFLAGALFERLDRVLERHSEATLEQRRVLEIDELVRLATAQAARAQTDTLFDQKHARHAYWELFGSLQAAGWGKRIPGRRRHRSRLFLRYPTTPGDEAGPAGLLSCLRELGIELDRDRSDDGPVPKEEPPTDTRALRPQPTRAEVVERIKSRREDLKSFGVASLQLFGSVARDEARPDSDVDLLVKFSGPVTSDAFFGVKFLLEDLLDRRVDLVTEAALREPIQRRIQGDLLRVA